VPRLPVRIVLFLSSYAPLWGVLAYRNRDAGAVWIVLGGIAVGSVLVLGALMWTYRKTAGAPLTIKRAKPRDAEVLSYIATYLIPFLDVDLSNRDEAITLVVFLVVLGVIYVNSSMLLVNPVLSVLGYRAWDIVDADEHEYMLVTRDPPKPTDVVTPVKVGEYLRVKV
jgi:hypothetical protein